MPDIEARAITYSGINWVAFSGGPDSTCLLHLLTTKARGARVRAVHIDHGLDEHSQARGRRAVEIAGSMGVACTLERLEAVRPGTGGGPEAAARHARYARLQTLMQHGDHVLTGHHADDQVETVMLRLLRGAGPEGLRGMQPLRRLEPGWLGRPLLEWTRAEILEYLECHGIDFLDDPTNLDLSLDRNYLRHRVLPQIGRRWPGYRSSIVQSSRWQGAAARAMQGEALLNLENLSRSRDRSGETTLDATGWLELDLGQSLAVIRAWCKGEGIVSPPTRPLSEFRDQCVTARHDRQPALVWQGGCLHSWRNRLWMDLEPAVPTGWQHDWPEQDECPVPAGGSLVWSGIARSRIGKDWKVGAPPRGARLRLHARGPEKTVSEMMRSAGIPPWRRHAYPALSIDGRLRAIGVDWMDAEFAEAMAQSASRLEWRHRPTALLP